MKVKIKDIMSLERVLLEFEAKHKFELDFDDAYTLHQQLAKVGKITNYAFLIQDEFHRRNDDIEELRGYHDKIMNSSVTFDYDETVSFIMRLDKIIKDEEIRLFIEKNLIQ